MANDLGAFVAAEVTRAEQDYQNVRTRAINLTGISGTVVALTSGLLAIAVHSSNSSAIPTDARWMVATALALFVASTVTALIINFPSRVTASKIDGNEGLARLVADDWGDEGWDQRVAQMQVKYLASLRDSNGLKANLLALTIALQASGMASLAIAVVMLAKDS